MDYITLLQAVPQFHQKLDEMAAKNERNHALLVRLKSILDMLVKEVGDLSNRYNCLERIKGVERRLDAMLIAAGKEASPLPANA